MIGDDNPVGLPWTCVGFCNALLNHVCTLTEVSNVVVPVILIGVLTRPHMHADQTLGGFFGAKVPRQDGLVQNRESLAAYKR